MVRACYGRDPAAPFVALPRGTLPRKTLMGSSSSSPMSINLRTESVLIKKGHGKEERKKGLCRGRKISTHTHTHTHVST